MNENDVLKGRLKDLANMSYRQNRYTYTNFMSAADMEVFFSNVDDLSFAGYQIFGGRESCDRVMIAFGRESDMGYSAEFPISMIKIAAAIDKFSDDLNHRDFLGALMNLGIESGSTGKHCSAYVFCVDTVANYIIDNITQIKHTNVKCRLCKADDIDAVEIKKDPLHIIATSARADAVIAAITGLSRSSTSLLFSEKKISLNNRLYENSSYQLKPGDIFSIRGYGKYEFTGTGSVTRKGRLNIDLLKYV